MHIRHYYKTIERTRTDSKDNIVDLLFTTIYQNSPILPHLKPVIKYMCQILNLKKQLQRLLNMVETNTADSLLQYPFLQTFLLLLFDLTSNFANPIDGVVVSTKIGHGSFGHVKQGMVVKCTIFLKLISFFCYFSHL